MKFLKLTLLVILSSVFLFSCKKDANTVYPPASGKFLVDAGGECTPINVHGDYYVNVPYTRDNYVDVSVDLVSTGTYDITTNRVNGMYFAGSGRLGDGGVNLVRLYAYRDTLPQTAATATTFTVQFYTDTLGTVNGPCTFDIAIMDPMDNPSVFTLGAATGKCSGAVVSGTYKKATPLTATDNKVVLQVNVLKEGGYDIATTLVNGIQFTGIGVFTSIGPQTVTLYGTGTPVVKGDYNIITTHEGQSCIFSISVTDGTGVPGPGVATYTLGGNSSTCTGATQTGTYMEGIALTSVNTITVQATVTAAGTYSISTNTVNGITFSKTGSFAGTGAQTIELIGSGTPTTAGANNYIITGGTGSCTVSVTAEAAAPPAVGTLGGTPGICTNAAVAGVYAQGAALSSTNTVTIEVNVTTAGSYSITTNTINGVQFSASGVFTSVGIKNVALIGSGTSTVSGNSDFTVTFGTSSCSFPIPFTAPSSPCSGLTDNQFSLSSGTTVDGAPIGISTGTDYQVSVQSGFIAANIVFNGLTDAPTPGTYTIGSQVSISCPDVNFITNTITWDATGGKVYITGSGSNLTLEFCEVQFKGTPATGGASSSATGKARLLL